MPSLSLRGEHIRLIPVTASSCALCIELRIHGECQPRRHRVWFISQYRQCQTTSFLIIISVYRVPRGVLITGSVSMTTFLCAFPPNGHRLIYIFRHHILMYCWYRNSPSHPEDNLHPGFKRCLEPFRWVWIPVCGWAPPYLDLQEVKQSVLVSPVLQPSGL